MSRLNITTPNKAQMVVEELYRDVERRIAASPPGLCPVDMSASFLKLSHAQSCGKCVPCRVGLSQLSLLLDDVLEGRACIDTLKLIKKTARVIKDSADCAIGYETANMVLKGVDGFYDDYMEHIENGRCMCSLNQPVPCVALCPAGVDIPGYIALISEGRYTDAVRLIRKDNPFPTACALVCEHPCEARCRRNMIDDSINIRSLKRYAVDHAGIVPAPPRGEATGKRVAIIGGGPGGLSAAYFLSLMGHTAVIYEKRSQLGGMLRYGIPSYRLPRERLDEDINIILSTGVHVHKKTEIGKDITIESLRDEFDCVYIAIGAHDYKKLGVEGEDKRGVISAVEMLRAIGDSAPEVFPVRSDLPDFDGKSVVIVGGGNVAMDCTRSAKRLGAKNVTCVYRRRKIDMTALPEEVEGAIAEGCEIIDLHAPVRIESNINGEASALWIQPQISGPIDKSGRPKPMKASAPEKRIPCDIIVVAIGQEVGRRPFEEYGVPVRRGVIHAASSGAVENTAGIFAGGDCITGPATLIRAVEAGKVAAANIDEYLGFKHVISSEADIPSAGLHDRPPCGRVNPAERPAEQRKQDFELVEYAMTDEEAMRESRRCLRCDHFGYGAFKGGRSKKW